MASVGVTECPGLWLSDCLPRSPCLCLPVRVCERACWCVGARRSSFVPCKLNLTPLVPRAISPQPSSTIILIDPHLFWMAPNPDNLSSNFSSLSNPSLSHSVTYWAGLKLPPLSLSHTIITRLTTWNMNTPTTPWQPHKPHVISLDLGDTATSHSTQRLGLSVRWEDIATDISTRCAVSQTCETPKYNPCRGKF